MRSFNPRNPRQATSKSCVVPQTSRNHTTGVFWTIQILLTKPQKRNRSSENSALRSEGHKKQVTTLTWNELSTWQQDNRFITSGYRPAFNSYKKSAASIWHIHNQSVNIWTHLLGAIGAAFSTFAFYGCIRPRFNMATSEDVFMFSCFFIGAAGCLSMSATYHAISNHSAEVAMFGNQLDCAFLFAYTQILTS